MENWTNSSLLRTSYNRPLSLGLFFFLFVLFGYLSSCIQSSLAYPPGFILMSLPAVLQQNLSPLGIATSILLAALLVYLFRPKPIMSETLQAYWRFAYGSFFKPHTGDGHGDQQEALESFYQSQAVAYDITRTTLLRGRDDMIELVAAQLKDGSFATKPIWVDVSLRCPRLATPLPSSNVFRLVVARAGTLSRWENM